MRARNLQMRIECMISGGVTGAYGPTAGSKIYRLSCDGEWIADYASLSRAQARMEEIAMAGHTR